MERLKTSSVSISNVSTKEFLWQIYCKNDYLIIFCKHCWCWHWKSKVSPCWWILNKIVFSEPYEILCFLTKKKWLTIFDKVLTPFFKTFLWLKQLFDAKIIIQCSKNETSSSWKIILFIHSWEGVGVDSSVSVPFDVQMFWGCINGKIVIM